MGGRELSVIVFDAFPQCTARFKCYDARDVNKQNPQSYKPHKARR